MRNNVLLYAAVVIGILVFTAWILLQNQNTVQVTIQSNDELIKQQSVLIKDLQTARVKQEDAIKTILITSLADRIRRDSITNRKQNVLVQKANFYKSQADSLRIVLEQYQQSDLKPIERIN